MRDKETKKYLIKKTSKSMISFCILCGFFIGSLIGQGIFYNSSQKFIKLTMVYSSEKNSWISESQILFLQYWNEKRSQNSSLKPIVLDFQPYGSGDMLISLLNNEIKPVIWSPASNIWIPILNTKWQELNNENVIAPNYTRIVFSPVVIAIWENYLADHPFQNISQLHDIIINNPNLKMAHTDPRESNSGFMTMIMLISSYIHKDPNNITMSDISNPELIEWIREIESSAIFYGKSTGFLGKYMRDSGPEALQLAFLYENLVQDYSKAAKERYGQKIVAVYPQEGVVYSDHPFCVLDANWISPEQKLVAEEYLNFLQSNNLVKRAILTGFRPINEAYLEDPEIYQAYLDSFKEEYGVTLNMSIIHEIIAPSDGNIISRIPDVWLLSRNK